jgi:SAM-dependent methyltransferase
VGCERVSVAAWDYTALASHYDGRADYCGELVDRVLAGFGLQRESCILDVGAGTGKLTGLLCATGARVVACEPNAAMRGYGVRKAQNRGAEWIAGSGELLPIVSDSIDLVAYGSSFNVLDARTALSEAARVLRPGGHWLALWNHRDLDDPLQRIVEAAIRRHLPTFDYGSRRQDPTTEVEASGAFGPVRHAEARFEVRMETASWLQAWRSHATLARQAGDAMDAVLASIAESVCGRSTLDIPYYTRLWWSRRGEQA